MDALHFATLKSPLGPVLVAGDAAGLRYISFLAGTAALQPEPDWVRDERPLAEALRQLRAYFAGDLQRFELPLAPRGTPFQQRVWQELRRIPYGQTISYGELARRIGRPSASRAVGAANGRNPLPIVVPCHRVIGSTGRLTGFAGGLHLKEGLLALEQAHAPAPSVGQPLQAALL
ncbi:MAG TPA: methylated-DNA--[protein]-cysteine S-methyltransferase [bacterium]|nr:methylated-DNA--[protein]-cysteine S-methyltransferase [bacterium]